MIFRFNQGSQKVMEGVQRVAFRPTCAEKVRRIISFKISLLSNLLTSSNLAAPARVYMRTYAHTRAHVQPIFRLGRLGG